MDTIELKVKKRETGKQAAKHIRKNGLIPGIFYVKGEESIPISAEQLSLRPIIYTSETKVINLEIEGEPGVHQCILEEIKLDPVTDKPIHFDLTGIRTDHIIRVEVPIIVKGQAVGTKEGGIVQHNLHKLEVHCLPMFIPNHIEVDISNLRLGKAIHLKDLTIPNVQITLPEDTVIVSCVPPRVTGTSKVVEEAEKPVEEETAEKEKEKEKPKKQ